MGFGDIKIYIIFTNVNGDIPNNQKLSNMIYAVNYRSAKTNQLLTDFREEGDTLFNFNGAPLKAGQVEIYEGQYDLPDAVQKAADDYTDGAATIEKTLTEIIEAGYAVEYDMDGSLMIGRFIND